MKNFLYISGIILMIIFAGSCKHEIPEPITNNPVDTTGTDTTGFIDTTGGGDNCDPNTVYFQQEILPILQSKCGVEFGQDGLGCHKAATDDNEYIQIVSYESLKSSSRAWDDSDPLDTRFWKMIEDNKMPQPGSGITLNADQKSLIFKWLQQGAQNNSCVSNNCDLTVDITYNTHIRPIIENNCQGCHSGSNINGGIDLGSYQSVKNVASTTRGGVSLLQGVVTHEDPSTFVSMPYIGSKPVQPKLNDCNIEKIKKWISTGMNEN